jgi:hypothetical protein
MHYVVCINESDKAINSAGWAAGSNRMARLLGHSVTVARCTEGRSVSGARSGIGWSVRPIHVTLGLHGR